MIKYARGLAACGALLLSAGIASAQSPSGAPESAPGVQVPATAPQTPAARPTAQPKRPPAVAEPRITAASPECAWSGRRILSLLARDDVDTAEKHRRFYEQFGCPTAHVGLALRCVISSELPPPSQGNVQQGQAHAKALAERVEQCWDKPSINYLNR